MKVMKSFKVKEVGALGEGFCHSIETVAGCEKSKNCLQTYSDHQLINILDVLSQHVNYQRGNNNFQNNLIPDKKESEPQIIWG